MHSATIVKQMGYGLKTATAGTNVRVLLPAVRGAYTRLTALVYTSGATAQTLACRMPIGTTTLSAAAAAAQAVIKLAAQPTAARNIATSDLIVVERKNSVSGLTFLQHELYTVHASTAPVVNADGTVTVTLAANVAGAHAAGDQVWLLSLDTDTIPGINVTNPKFNIQASKTALDLFNSDVVGAGGIIGPWNRNEPMLLDSTNATNAITLEWVAAVGVVFGQPHGVGPTSQTTGTQG